MILQNIFYPTYDFNPTLSAFIRVKGKSNYAVNVNNLIMDVKTRADFNTYFNGFSIEKFQKYTQIIDVNLHLVLKGKFEVILYNEYRQANKNIKIELARYIFESEELEGLDIKIPQKSYKGLITFALISMQEDSVFYNGYYFTNQSEKDFEEVNFAIDICTFKRESFVQRNMNLFIEKVMAEESPLKDKFEIFISDNGKSLELINENKNIHIFPNKNAGGAGGFGRAMIEILRSPNYNKFTHIIMMDDDIVFNYETLWRTYILALTLKPEYKSAFIGGAMLKLNAPQIQSEAKNYWNLSGNHPVKYNYNITDLKYVLKNEIEDKGNHFGWWYCVMPIGVVKANNLPLPIFIKRDDVEYGLRNGNTFINLNGLCVLHEAFDVKRQGYLEYYYWRNMCIINSIHQPKYNGERLKQQLYEITKKCLLNFRYDDANLALTGVEDFLKGVDWLKSTDVEALNQYVMNYTYKAVSPEELNINFIHGLYEKNEQIEKQLKAKVKPSKHLSVNKKIILSMFKKSNETRYVKMNNPSSIMFYNAKTVINYDETTNKAFVTKKSIKEALNLLKNYKKICKLIDEKYDRVKNEYAIRYNELINIEFWDNYLGLYAQEEKVDKYVPETIIKKSTDVHKLRKTIVEKRDRKFLFKVKISRTVQHCFLWWLPIKNNRVTFYLHERKGYTCNIKYISQELHKKYGNKVEIIWVTKYPELFNQLAEEGYKVVRLNSKQHILYQFTSKVIITNDAFPESVVLRHNQFTINTWHAGMNYKKIGPEYCNFRNDIAKKLFMIRNKQPSAYLAGSQYFIDDTSVSFGYDKNVFLPYGMARNDIFFKDNVELRKKILAYYAIPEDTKIVLYAPTFRDGFNFSLNELDFDLLKNALINKFGGEWKILFRKHYFVKNNNTILGKDVIDVSAYEDMNELLAISDVLISDYSSCLWDFTLTQRPAFVYAPDLDEYHINDRDFSYPIEKWPYSIAQNNEEILYNIENFDIDNYLERVKEHHRDAVNFDDGHATERAIKLIESKIKI